MATFDVFVYAYDYPAAYKIRRERPVAGEIVSWRTPDTAEKYGVITLLTSRFRIIRVTDVDEAQLYEWADKDALLDSDPVKGSDNYFPPRSRKYRAKIKNIPPLANRKYPDVTAPVFANHPVLVARMIEKFPELSDIKNNQKRDTIFDYQISGAVFASFFELKAEEPRDILSFKPKDDLVESQGLGEDDGIR